MIEGARCPVHDAPATDACGRCGRFVCVTCQRLRDADVFCEACRAEVPEVRPLTGWMAFAGLSLLLAPMSLVMALGTLWTRLREASLGLLEDPEARAWVGSAAFEAFLLALLSGFAIFLLPRYFGRRRAAPRLAQGFFAATIVAGLVSVGLHTAAELEARPAQLAALAASIVWLAVFRVSKTVAQVFVR